MPRKKEIRKGDNVIASKECANNPLTLAQLQRRTGLNEEELKQGPLQVIDTVEGQLKMKHPRLSQPFTAHPKFFQVASPQNT